MNLYERIGAEQARAVIKNTNCVEVSDNPHRLLEEDSLYDMLSSVRIISAEPPEHLDQWLFIGTPHASLPLPSDTKLAGRFPRKLVLEWLDRRRIRAEAGETVPAVPMVVLALQSSFDHASLLLEANTEAERKGIIELVAGNLTPNLCWYWRGSFLKCMEENKKHKDLRIKWFVMDLKTPTGEVIELHIMVLMVKGLPGFITRAYNSHAATAMAPNLLAFNQQGYAVPIGDDEFNSVGDVAADAVGNVSTYWNEF